MIQAITKLIDNWHARRLQDRAYLARLTEKYMRYVAGEEGLVRYLDASLSDEYGTRVKPTHGSDGYYDQEHRYSTHLWVYAAVNVLAEKSSVPELMLVDADGEEYESPLPSVPNPEHTWDEIEQLIAIFLELTGNAYLYHDKEEDTYWPLRPSRVRIVAEKAGRGVAGYAYNNADKGPNGQSQPKFTKSAWMYDDPEMLFYTKGEFQKRLDEYHGWITKGQIGQQLIKKEDDWIPFEKDEVLHFRYVSPNHDFYGLAPLCSLMTNLQTDLFARAWNLNFFENGAIPPGVLIIPRVFPEKEFNKIKQQFDKQFLGTKNRGKPLVVQGGAEGATYTSFPGQHRDLEFLEGLARNQEETLIVFGVPLEMLGASRITTQTSARSPGIQEKKRIFWQDTMMPKQKMKAAVWTKHFQKELPKGFAFGYDYSLIEALKPDRSEQARAATAAIKSGMTIEEVRTEIWGLPAEWEGVILVPANMVAIRHGDSGVRTLEKIELSEDSVEVAMELLEAADD